MPAVGAALLGRDQEIEQLAQTLDEVRSGQTGFIVISGEAGIGKSSLLDELARLATERGCLTLEGRASEYDQELPFGVFTDALDAYVASLGSQDVERLAMDRLGAAAAVFPSLAAIDQAVEYPTSATERFRVHRAVRDVLERLAARRPLVLILDDLHWADDASLELITYLLRHPPQAEVLLTTALRPGQGSAGLLGALDGIRTSPMARNIDLGPLSIDDIETLVGERAAELHHLSGGNPFYAIQLARADPADSGGETLADLGVPAAVANAIVNELRGLSENGRDLAEAAAVVGDPFEIEVAAGASGQPEDSVISALDELVAKDLVRTTEVPRRFRFRHPVVRGAVYSTCPPGVRISCHERVVSFLEERGASVGELAYHVEQSAQRGDMRAVGILRRAAAEAADNAPASAIRWYGAALRLLSGEGHEQEQIDILTSLASSLMVLGRIGEAFDCYEQARDLAASFGDTPVSLVIDCARAEQLLGRFDDSTKRLDRAYSEAQSKDSPDAVAIAVAMATTLFNAGEYPQSLEWGSRAASSADTVGNRPLLAAALATQAMGAALSGEVVTASDIRTSAADLVEGIEDDLMVERLDALANLSVAELYLDRYIESVQHGERCLTLARATGQTHLMPALAPAVGSSWWVVGDLAKSAAVFDDAIDAGRLAGNIPSIAWCLFNRALTALWAGDIDDALAFSSESLTLCNSFETGIISTYAGVIHGMVLFETGEPAAAIEQITGSAGGPGIPLLPGAWRPFYIETLTRCHLALGNLTKAAEHADWARREADGFAMPMPLMMADRAEAEVALAADEPLAALEFARSSKQRAVEFDSRLHIAVSTLLIGRTLMAMGDVDGAVNTLVEGAAEFDEMGMKRHRDQSEMLLRKLGHTVHRRSRPGKGHATGVGSLTGREMEIAGLVVDRRTNREIADQLFLSTKTVETHMRNIFNKLGVSSRVEVARAITAAR